MNSRLLPLLLLSALCAAFLAQVTGCAGLDADNRSARSWNEPRGMDQNQGFRDPTRARY